MVTGDLHFLPSLYRVSTFISGDVRAGCTVLMFFVILGISISLACSFLWYEKVSPYSVTMALLISHGNFWKSGRISITG